VNTKNIGKAKVSKGFGKMKKNKQKNIASQGGKARSAKMTPERRSEIARMGGLAAKKRLQ
jgi:general stress protein YciG